MGIFDFLFKKESEKKENQLKKINNSLKSSFSNVRKDITHIHGKLLDHKDHTHSRFQDIEERVRKLELVLAANQPQKITKILVQRAEETDEIEEPDRENVLSLLRGMPRAELMLFKTLFELQQSLNAKHISYKSLASYLYPGKDYNSIRSTITQFVLRLNTEGLIDKKRIGKETYIKVSQQGHKILKNVKIKKIIKEIETKE